MRRGSFFWNVLLAAVGLTTVAGSLDMTPVARGANLVARAEPPESTCPPCFNCLLPAFECKQFADCDKSNGQCICPPGFGTSDCSEPVCGGLTQDKSLRPVRNGTTCECLDGWGGINCNMCTRDSVCNALMPDKSMNGTCYTGGELVHQNYQVCNVTNRKILDILAGKIPQVTFTCNKEDLKCQFQFWVDERESFFCGLEECSFETDRTTNLTKYQCKKAECACVPGRMLCGENGSIDISDFLTMEIKGPGYYECKGRNGECLFSEPAMNGLISSVFGDPHITLGCEFSECLHYTEVPDYIPPPPKKASSSVITVAAVSALSILLLGAWVINHFIQSGKKLSGSGAGYYSLATSGDASKLLTQHNPTTIQFENLGYVLQEKQILDGVFGSVNPGEVMAIMGGSGAGKTTLIDILAHKAKSGHVTGDIWVNGKSIPPKMFKRVSGFVDQEDYLLPTLTVYETVLASALLRLPKTMTDESKRMRALDTIEQLGILSIKDKPIGNEDNRGISGGEKRRVAIACELVTSPSILFLDEPTSGLDAFNAYNVVESLVTLARTYKRTVIFTIHQPRSNIVSMFDKLLLLANGKLVYSGSQAEVTQFFTSQGYSCPPGYNVADFAIDVTMKGNRYKAQAGKTPEQAVRQRSAGDSSALAHPEDEDEDIHSSAPPKDSTDSTREWRHYASHRLSEEPPTAESSAHASGIDRETNIGQEPARALQDPYGDGAASRDMVSNSDVDELVEAFKGSYMAAAIRSDIEEVKRLAEAESDEDIALFGYERIGFWKQFVILSDRTFKNLYRNPMLLLTHYIIAIFLAIFCGLLYFNIANDISGFQNRLGLFFFLLALFGFSTLTTLHLFGQERIIFVRERANGYYSPLAYYTAKVLFDIVPLRVLPPIILGIIVYPLVGLNSEGPAFFIFLLILILFNLTASATCLVIGVLIKDSGVASLVGVLFMLFSLLFAGLFLNHDSMPEGTVVFQYLSIFHYAYEALTVNEVRYLTLTEHKFGLDIEVPGATILSTFGFDSSAVWDDILGLFVIFAVFLVGGYVAMHYVLVEHR